MSTGTARRARCSRSNGSTARRSPISSAWRRKADDLKKLGVHVLQSFLRHAMRDGFFHADMHQGNLFVDRKGRLVAIDFGIMGRLGKKERRFLAEIFYGFITRDYRRVAEVHFEAGYVPIAPFGREFSQAMRAIGEPLHTINASDISMARLLTLLFEVTALFDMRTRTELVLLQKTMVVAEGVARTLDPRLLHLEDMRSRRARLDRGKSRAQGEDRRRLEHRGTGQTRNASAQDARRGGIGDQQCLAHGRRRRRSVAGVARSAGGNPPALGCAVVARIDGADACRRLALRLRRSLPLLPHAGRGRAHYDR